MPWPFAQKLASVLGSASAPTSSSPSTRFAFKLFHELANAEAPNIFLSPSSVMLCLALVHELATGDTRQAIAKALEIADLAPADAQLVLTALKSAFRPRPDVTITAANSLWCGNGAQVRPDLAANLHDLYDAELTTLDFASADAVPRINAWVSGKTNGLISRILDSLSPLAVLVAINAVYFNGRWINAFHPAMTRDRPFTTAAGQKKQLPIMLQGGKYKYFEKGRLQAVALPYLGDVTMYVVLPPDKADVRQFLSSLTSVLWESWLAQFELLPGTIWLPRFKLDCAAQLEPALKALGMEPAFDPHRAEFGGILTDRPPVWIDQVLHRAVVEVNEEGTKAAAVTMAPFSASAMRSVRPPREFEMIVDRPFFIAIRDEATGTILFIGWIGDPQ
jgi:serine protease inhibitor